MTLALPKEMTVFLVVTPPSPCLADLHSVTPYVVLFFSRSFGSFDRKWFRSNVFLLKMIHFLTTSIVPASVFGTIQLSPMNPFNLPSSRIELAPPVILIFPVSHPNSTPSFTILTFSESPAASSGVELQPGFAPLPSDVSLPRSRCQMPSFPPSERVLFPSFDSLAVFPLR